MQAGWPRSLGTQVSSGVGPLRSIKHLILSNARLLHERSTRGAQPGSDGLQLETGFQHERHNLDAAGTSGLKPFAQSFARPNEKCPAITGHLELGDRQTIYTASAKAASIVR